MQKQKQLITSDGLRQRRPTYASKKQLTEWEQVEQSILDQQRDNLLNLNHPSRQKEASSISQNRFTAMESQLKHVSSLLEQVAQTQHAQAEQELAFTEEQSAAAARIESGVSIVQRGTTELRVQARDINSKVTESLTLTKRIDKNVTSLKRMVATPGGAASLMMNPMFALVVFFLMHPYIPVTVEAVMSVWSVVLSANFVKQVSVRIQRGEDLFDFSGGPIGIVKNIAFSAPHIISIMWKLGSLWTAERTGTRKYTAANAATFSETMEPSNWEPFLMQQFMTGMEAARNFNMQTIRDVHFEIPQPNITEWRMYLESASADTWEEVRSMDPMLFKDPAGIIQLLLEYISGKLVIRARTVGVATFNMPAYLHQARTVMTAEAWVYQSLFHMFKDIFTRFFKDTWETVVQVTCTALCVYSPIMPEEPRIVGGGRGIFTWVSSTTAKAYEAVADTVTSGVSAVTSTLAHTAVSTTAYIAETTIARKIRDIDYVGNMLGFLARWACDCSKYKKVKMDGGNRTRRSKSKSKSNSNTKTHSSKSNTKTHSSKSKRNRTTKYLHVPADHADFLRLSWGFALLNLSPLLMGVPIFHTPDAVMSLDAEMSKLLLFKLDQGQFVPSFVLEGVGVRDYYLI